MRDNTYINKSKAISKELKELSLKLEYEGVKDHHNQARKMINQKYGKGWREELYVKDINSNPNENHFGKINYY